MTCRLVLPYSKIWVLEHRSIDENRLFLGFFVEDLLKTNLTGMTSVWKRQIVDVRFHVDDLIFLNTWCCLIASRAFCHLLRTNGANPQAENSTKGSGSLRHIGTWGVEKLTIGICTPGWNRRVDSVQNMTRGSREELQGISEKPGQPFWRKSKCIDGVR